MNPTRCVEATGESVEAAIASGLAELGVGPTEVIVEVLEEPSRGVFGLGSHPAKVRLQLLTVPKPAAPPPPPATLPEDDERIELPTPRQPRAEKPGAEARAEARAERPQRAASKPAADYEVSDEDEGVLVEAEEVPESEQDDEAQIAKVVLGEILDKMEITARIAVRRARPGEPGETVPWVLDVMGGNLNRLVGRRGETLAALQYITRLITSRELQRRSEVVVDIAGYKARRAQTLHALALRMADEAVQRNRTVSLEPMPPHERRIIHLALRERPDVETRSVGEGSARKVTIVPSPRA
ncbi:MAG: Jag N-terminal domain-containing protein [Anaerolineae bacterium]|nr:Jag N-terminal domain-containing protein [Anaerolineae bacterium]